MSPPGAPSAAGDPRAGPAGGGGDDPRRSPPATLVLLRHGRTPWNDEGRFTGWEDPPLSAGGQGDAGRAGTVLASTGLRVDAVFTSLALRTTATARLALAALGDPHVATTADWRLNERHFGSLQGLDRATATERHGRKALRRWRHDDLAAPPPIPATDPRHPRHDPRYVHVPPELLPGSESLADLAARTLACWRDQIGPSLAGGRTVLVVGHCHGLRALVAHLTTGAGGALPPTFDAPGSLSIGAVEEAGTPRARVTRWSTPAP